MEITNKKAITFIIFSLAIFSTSIILNLDQTQDSELKINPYFDLTINNVAQPRQATAYDIYLGVADFGEAGKFHLYKSKTIVTNDFSKLFIGGRA
jgi:hypothetical protein